jgi:uncharacterized protein (TIGR02145 family)
MKKLFFLVKFSLVAACLFFHFAVLAQVGVGTVSPTAGTKFEIVGAGTTSATTALLVRNSSSATPLLLVRDDGKVSIGNYLHSNYNNEILAGVDPAGYFYGTGSGLNSSNIPIYIGDRASNIIFSTSTSTLQGSEKMRITSGGSVGIGTISPTSTALLELSSDAKGFLPPRMTTAQRNAITSPATGLVVFNTSVQSLEVKSSSGWQTLRALDYPSIQIGTQYWMDKNLEVTTYSNGDIIPYVPDATTWAGLTSGAWCYYNNDPSSGYGKLYNWYAAADSRGLCPAGWHVPTDVEWTALATFLGGSSVAGGKMKTTGTTRWAPSPNVNSTNSSGFAALPGGYRQSDGTTTGSPGSAGYWWSSTQSSVSTTAAWSRSLYYDDNAISMNEYPKKNGFSVRCIKN